MFATDTLPDDLLRMAHRNDPDTSHAAAKRARSGTKVAEIRGAILTLLEAGPATARELHREYFMHRSSFGWPRADLLDIRRRLTELKHDLGSVEDSGERRNGEAVMRLTEEKNR